MESSLKELAGYQVHNKMIWHGSCRAGRKKIACNIRKSNILWGGSCFLFSVFVTL